MKNSNEQMRKAIREALDSYHITQQAAVDDTGFFLVDALTPSWETSIEKGQLELDSLADHIFYALRRAQPAPAAGDVGEIDREAIAKEIVRYFAGYSYSKHEFTQCLGCVDVLIAAGVIKGE